MGGHKSRQLLRRGYNRGGTDLLLDQGQSPLFVMQLVQVASSASSATSATPATSATSATTLETTGHPVPCELAIIQLTDIRKSSLIYNFHLPLSHSPTLFLFYSSTLPLPSDLPPMLHLTFTEGLA
jgi:hypothetical protein